METHPHSPTPASPEHSAQPRLPFLNAPLPSPYRT